MKGVYSRNANKLLVGKIHEKETLKCRWEVNTKIDFHHKQTGLNCWI
jgi:hypothetical protein